MADASGFALAYNLGNFHRRLALPRSVKHWSLIPARRDCFAEQDPRTHSSAPATGSGAGMTVEPDETAGGRGGDGDSLPVLGPNARMKGVSGTITVRQLVLRSATSQSSAGRWSPKGPPATTEVVDNPPR